MGNTVEDYVNRINGSNSPDKAELVKFVEERGQVVNRSGEKGVTQFLRLNEDVLDKTSEAEKRLETARKVSAALGGEEVQLIDTKKIAVKASPEEVAGKAKTEVGEKGSTPATEKPSASAHVEGKVGKAAGSFLKTGLKAVAMLTPLGAVVSGAQAAERSGEISKSDLPTDAKVAAVGFNAAMVAANAVDASLGASTVLQQAAKEKLVEQHGEKIRPLLVSTDGEVIKEAVGAAKGSLVLENADKLKKDANQYREDLGKPKQIVDDKLARAMRQVDDEGLKTSEYKGAKADHNSIQAMQVAAVKPGGVEAKR